MSQEQTKKIEYIAINDLIPYVNNARVHSEEQILQIASSIKEFGFNNPVLIDKGNGIIAGHGRVYAARKLGLEGVSGSPRGRSEGGVGLCRQNEPNQEV